jgi:ATP-dependent exoDNAse (exonuclease V) beta subunit
MSALCAPHPRDALIQFEEEGHKYTIGDGSRKYTSVTTFLGALFEPFEPDKVIENMMRGKKWAQSPYYGMEPEAIKAQWAAAGAEAAQLGTTLHADIERFYKGEPVENASPEYGYFQAFAAQCPLRPYRAEWKVFHEEAGIVGTIDMVFERPDGQLEIYDWKRCKKLEKSDPWNKTPRHAAVAHLPDTNFWHYALQLNLYQFVLEAKYAKKVAARSLVVLHPNAKTYQVAAVPDLQQEIRDLLSL